MLLSLPGEGKEPRISDLFAAKGAYLFDQLLYSLIGRLT